MFKHLLEANASFFTGSRNNITIFIKGKGILRLYLTKPCRWKRMKIWSDCWSLLAGEGRMNRKCVLIWLGYEIWSQGVTGGDDWLRYILYSLVISAAGDLTVCQTGVLCPGMCLMQHHVEREAPLSKHMMSENRAPRHRWLKQTRQMR